MKVAKLYPDAVLPTRKHPTDVGLDLYAYISGVKHPNINPSISIPKGEFEIIHTGTLIKIPDGCFGWITNKSKNNFLIGGGIVDQDYQGEILIKVINPNNYTEFIYHGDAIAQLIILPAIIPGIEEASLQDIFKEKTARGADGGIARQMEWTKTIPIDIDDYDYVEDDLNFDASREDAIFGRNR